LNNDQISNYKGQAPLISVLMPFYKGGKFIEYALNSILNQTFQDFEIVLVDNNATPESKEVVSRFSRLYPDKIKLFYEKNPGACYARNTGIIHCTGKYIALLDDDDYMYSDRLEKQLKIMEENKDLAMVSCGIDFFESPSTPDKGRFLRKNVMGAIGNTRITRDLLISKIYSLNPTHKKPESFFFAIPSTWFFKKDNALDIGLFDIRMNPHWADDLEFLTRLFEKGPFYMVPEPLAGFRNLSPSSGSFEYKTSSEIDFKKARQDSKFLSIFFERYKESNPETLIAFKKLFSFHLKMHGIEFLEFFHAVPIGRKFLLRAFLLDPFNFDNAKQMIKSRFPKFVLPKLFWFDRFSMKKLPEGVDSSVAFNLFFFPPNRVSKNKVLNHN